MSIAHVVAVLVVLLLLAFFTEPVARWLYMPCASMLVIAGFVASELALIPGIDTGIRSGTNGRSAGGQT